MCDFKSSCQRTDYALIFTQSVIGLFDNYIRQSTWDSSHLTTSLDPIHSHLFFVPLHAVGDSMRPKPHLFLNMQASARRVLMKHLRVCGCVGSVLATLLVVLILSCSAYGAAAPPDLSG